MRRNRVKDARVRAQDNIGRHTQPERNGLTQPAGTSGRTTHELQDSVREVLRRSAHLFDDSAVRSGESEDEHQRNEAGTRHRRVRRDRARRVLSLTFRRRGGGEENANVYGDNLPTAGEEKKNNVNENRGHRRLGGFHRRRLSTPSNAHSNKLEDQTRAPLASANVHAPCDQNLKAVSVKEECNKLREMLRKEQVTSRAAVEQVQSLKAMCETQIARIRELECELAAALIEPSRVEVALRVAKGKFEDKERVLILGLRERVVFS